VSWIGLLEAGTVEIPDGIQFREASFLEPLNTCLKALETAELAPGEVVLVVGRVDRSALNAGGAP